MMQRLRNRVGSNRKQALLSHPLAFEWLEARRVLADFSGFIGSDLTITDTSEPARFVGNTTIGNGVQVEIGPGVDVEILNSVQIDIDGKLILDSPNQISFFDDNGFSSVSTTGINVRSGGTLDAQNTTFALVNPSSDHSRIDVESGGRFQVDNSTIAIDGVNWFSGSLLANGDVTGNTFESPIWLPGDFISDLEDNKSFGLVQINNANITSTISAKQMGTVSTADLQYRFSNDVTISSGAGITFDTGTKVEIANGVIVDVEGVLKFDGSAQIVIFEDNGFSSVSTSGINVSSGGLLQTTDTNMLRLSSSSDRSEINIEAGGRFQSTDSNLNIDEIFWAGGALLNATDVTGNAFAGAIRLPGDYIPNVVNNKSFGLVQIHGTPISSDFTATLMGTESTANLRYLFDSDVTIVSGSDVTFAPGTRVEIGTSVFVEVEGTLTFDKAAQVGIYESNGSSSVVRTGFNIRSGGLLNADETNFARLSTSSDSSEINVFAGGRLQASDSNLNIDTIVWEGGSLLGNSDVTGNVMPETTQLPGDFIPNLVNNRSFGLVQIHGTPITSVFTATLMGTDSTANLRYQFGSVTIVSGAHLTFAPGTRVEIGNTVFVEVEGTLTFDKAAQVGIYESNGFSSVVSSGINVHSGGLLEVDETNFLRLTSSSDQSEINVLAGGRFQATNSNLNIDKVFWAEGSLLSAGDVVGNAMPSAIRLPGDFIPQLVNNRSFNLVQIHGTPITTEFTATQMGTESTANLRYQFDSDVTIISGAGVTFAPGTIVEIATSVFVSIEGKLEFDNIAELGIDENNGFSSITRTGINVHAGGSLTAVGTNFVKLTSTTDVSEVVVFDGGQLELINTDYELDLLNLQAGSQANLNANFLQATLFVHSDTVLLDASDNSFAAGSVDAFGDPVAVIDLRNNFWGTLNPVEIENNILHRVDDGNRPLVLFDPITNGAPIFAGADSFQVDADQVLTQVSPTLLVNDNDNEPGPNPLSILAINGLNGNVGAATVLPSGATVTVQSDGMFTYDPNGAFNLLASGSIQADTFQYTLTDGVSTDVATVTINVRGTNETTIAPTITPIADQQTDEDTSIGSIVFTVGDVDDDVNTLIVRASAANPALVPASGISITGTGTTRSLTITPAVNQFGTTDITVTVEDGRGGFVNETFELTVNSVNDAPTISPIGKQLSPVDTVLNIPFSIADLETASASLLVNATADNPAVVQSAVIVGAGANRTLQVTPVAGVQGTSQITLTVDDGQSVASRTFDVEFINAGVVLDFVFDIPGVGQVTPDGNIELPPGTEVTVSIVANNLLGSDISFYQLNFENSDVGVGELMLSDWNSAFTVAVDSTLNTPTDSFVAQTTTVPSTSPSVLGTFKLQTPAFDPVGSGEFLLSVNRMLGDELTDTLIAGADGVEADLLQIVDFGDVQIRFDLDGPQVANVELNAGLADTPDLGSGPQPTSWANQRSDIRTMQITFSEEVGIVTANQLVLTNLGVNADVDADQVIPLTDGMLSQAGNVVTIQFDRNQLADGVYKLEILSSVADLLGNSLDGDGDGLGGDAFEIVGNSSNQLFRLQGDYNGTGGVNVQDGSTLTYWFGQTVGTAPEYVDVNDSGGVNILDFSAYIGNFQTALTFPAPVAPASAPIPPELEGEPAATGSGLASQQPSPIAMLIESEPAGPSAIIFDPLLVARANQESIAEEQPETCEFELEPTTAADSEVFQQQAIDAILAASDVEEIAFDDFDVGLEEEEDTELLAW